MTTKVFYRNDGTPCQYPGTKATAKRLRYNIYDTGKLCHECEERGDTTYIRYVINDSCVHCCRLKSIQEYGEGVHKYNRPLSPDRAIERGLDHYWRPEACEKAGHVGKRTLEGECYICELGVNLKLPLIQDTHPGLVLDQNAANVLGFKVFRTGRTCKKGHSGWRYLSNGGCITCKEEKGKN